MLIVQWRRIRGLSSPPIGMTAAGGAPTRKKEEQISASCEVSEGRKEATSRRRRSRRHFVVENLIVIQILFRVPFPRSRANANAACQTRKRPSLPYFFLPSFPSPHLGPIVWVNRSRAGEREKPPCTVSPSPSLN